VWAGTTESGVTLCAVTVAPVVVSRETASGPGQPNGAVAVPVSLGKPSPGAAVRSVVLSIAVLNANAFIDVLGPRHQTSPVDNTPKRPVAAKRVHHGGASVDTPVGCTCSAATHQPGPT
jgi:hypothetical protein